MAIQRVLDEMQEYKHNLYNLIISKLRTLVVKSYYSYILTAMLYSYPFILPVVKF